MCYSVMVETDLKKLEKDFKAIVDVEGFLEILKARKSGRKNLKVARGLESYFATPQTPVEAECKRLIDEFTNDEIQKFKTKADLQLAKIDDLQAKLDKRWSKTNQTKLETAQRVLEKAQYDIVRLGGPIIPTDSAIFQYYYAPLLVREGDRNRIRFFRYQIRPRWADREPNRQINMFNARVDKLHERKSWTPLFMHQHAVLIMKGFYEWVEHPETGKNQIINFFPADGKPMWVPALYETWKGGAEEIDSFAVLTREPPPEVESMGHDRCPVFPEWKYMEEWLRPESQSKQFYYQMFDALEPVSYEFAWAA